MFDTTHFWLIKKEANSLCELISAGRETNSSSYHSSTIRDELRSNKLFHRNPSNPQLEGFLSPLCVICLVVMETICVVCQRECWEEGLVLLSGPQSHFRRLNESLCVSLQSFLVLRDSVTCEPSLLCVSAGETSKDILHYKIQHTASGMQTSFILWFIIKHDESDPNISCSTVQFRREQIIVLLMQECPFWQSAWASFFIFIFTSLNINPFMSHCKEIEA